MRLHHVPAELLNYGGRYFDMPFHIVVDAKNHVNNDTECTADNYASRYVGLKLTEQSDNICIYYSQANFDPRSGANCTFSLSGGDYPINAYCWNCDNGTVFLFTNHRTGKSIKVLDIINWNWSGRTMFSFPDPDVDYTTLI